MRTFFIAFFCLVAVQAFSQSHRNEFGFQSDNDSYLAQRSDRYYTNGLFIYYRRGLAVNPADTQKLKNKVLGIEAGQQLFNPSSGNIANSRLIDRPFAAYLYLGANLNWLYSNESNLKLSAQTGMIGPSALGEQSQNFIHNTFGFYQLRGWEYQIENSFQLNLAAEYNRLLGRSQSADLVLNTYGNLGTGFTGAGAGLLVRMGHFNQLYNTVSTQSTAIKQRNFIPLQKRELFFYLKPLVRYVAYNGTIESSLFRHGSRTNDNEITLTQNTFVFSQKVGAAYGGKRWIVDMAAIFSTKDVKQMRRAHQWGSVTLLYRFN